MSDTSRCKMLHDRLSLSDDKTARAKWLGLAVVLEQELIAANKIIADAREYVEEFREFPMEDGLMAILEGRAKETGAMRVVR